MENRKKVIKNLKVADILLICLPLVLLPPSVMAIFIVTEQPGVMNGIAGLAGAVLGIIFCVVYGVAAFILALVMRRNKTFRLSLVVCLALVLAASLLLSI
jgi:hypothetical protein